MKLQVKNMIQKSSYFSPPTTDRINLFKKKKITMFIPLNDFVLLK